MGYPMTYVRILKRSDLEGEGYASDYSPEGEYRPLDQYARLKANLKGDLRRLEADQQDARHISAYAKQIGITEEQARAFLALFFSGGPQA